MASRQGKREHDISGDTQFASTQWSLVLAAGRGASADAPAALEELCRRYWRPLYVYVRRRVRDDHEAQDLVQEFFSSLLEKDTVAVAEPERGRFRAFLLTSFRNFLANQHQRKSARKRGGGSAPLSLDMTTGEFCSTLEPVDSDTPERLYDRQWATTLLELVLGHLRDEMTRSGRADYFEQLSPFLAGRNRDVSYATAARRLGVSEGAAMVAAHRLRRRYRDLLHSEIAQTVADPQDVEEEIRSLFASLSQ